MKTSISSPQPLSPGAPSRSRRMVEAGRAATASATKSACRTRLRLQVGAAIDAGDTRQQIVDFRLRRRGDARARLALGAGSNDAALLQHVFPDCETNRRLLLVADQRQMRVEQVMRGIAARFLRQPHHID